MYCLKEDCPYYEKLLDGKYICSISCTEISNKCTIDDEIEDLEKRLMSLQNVKEVVKEIVRDKFYAEFNEEIYGGQY